jgi:hypothetical protein
MHSRRVHLGLAAPRRLTPAHPPVAADEDEFWSTLDDFAALCFAITAWKGYPPSFSCFFDDLHLAAKSMLRLRSDCVHSAVALKNMKGALWFMENQIYKLGPDHLAAYYPALFDRTVVATNSLQFCRGKLQNVEFAGIFNMKDTELPAALLNPVVTPSYTFVTSLLAN